MAGIFWTSCRPGATTRSAPACCITWALPQPLTAFAIDHPLATELQQACYALLPGFQRITLDQGRVSLTLSIGELQPMLAEQSFVADTIRVGTPARLWDKWAVKLLTRRCQRGTHLQAELPHTAAEVFVQAGFQIDSLVSASGFSRRIQSPLGHCYQPPRCARPSPPAPPVAPWSAPVCRVPASPAPWHCAAGRSRCWTSTRPRQVVLRGCQPGWSCRMSLQMTTHVRACRAAASD